MCSSIELIFVQFGRMYWVLSLYFYLLFVWPFSNLSLSLKSSKLLIAFLSFVCSYLEFSSSKLCLLCYYLKIGFPLLTWFCLSFACYEICPSPCGFSLCISEMSRESSNFFIESTLSIGSWRTGVQGRKMINMGWKKLKL